jgi:hypothetical protein
MGKGMEFRHKKNVFFVCFKEFNIIFASFK